MEGMGEPPRGPTVLVGIAGEMEDIFGKLCVSKEMCGTCNKTLELFCVNFFQNHFLDPNIGIKKGFGRCED